MIIHIVEEGDTLNSIAAQYELTPERVVLENELPNPERLVIGQSLGIRIPEVVHTVAAGDTLASVAEEYDIQPNQILMHNPQIAVSDTLTPGDDLVISYRDEEKIYTVSLNGYAYPFINRDNLRKTLPFLTFLSIFTYGFSPSGELFPADDEALIALANQFGVAPIMVLAPMNEEGAFDTQIAHNMFTNPAGQTALINNLVSTLQEKGYRGIDIDFEFILPEDRQNFLNFITAVHTRLQEEGLLTFVALAPKTSGTQVGLLYEAHDYPAIGGVADYVLVMTYEWGYTYGPPMATSPINNMRTVLTYAVSAINPDKILMGIPNYAYDWPLPFVQGETAAENISNQDAIVRAVRFGVDISFDQTAQSPFYYYTDEGVQHVVWFDDVRSMNSKLRLIPEFGLYGGGVWQIMNFFPGLWLVVDSLFNVRKL
jgi:spore germination protein